MWSIGVATFIILTGRPPFYCDSISMLSHKITNNKVEYDPDEWGHLSKEAGKFVKRCLSKDPKTRLKPGEALAHPWILK
jgi:serine/threonine protein kinase